MVTAKLTVELLQEALFVICHEAYPHCKVGRFKTLVTLKMEVICSTKIEPHGAKSQKLSLIVAAVKTS
jgi:hypothetical protein